MAAASLQRNSEWFAHQNLGEFAGQWVCVIDQKVVGQHETLEELVRIVGPKTKGKVPFIARVPEGFVTV